jgi:hypothetical protein
MEFEERVARLTRDPYREALRELPEIRRTLDRLERALIERARLRGVSWRGIGDDLDLSRQTAHRRYRVTR